MLSTIETPTTVLASSTCSVLPPEQIQPASPALAKVVRATVQLLPLSQCSDCMTLPAREFDALAQQSALELRRTAAAVPVLIRRIVACNSELHAPALGRDPRLAVDQIVHQTCDGLPDVNVVLPSRCESRPEFGYRQEVLRHLDGQAVIPAFNLHQACERLAERAFVGSFEYCNNERTVAQFRYSRSVATDRVLSRSATTSTSQHVAREGVYERRIRTDEHLHETCEVETTEELLTREHVIIAPRENAIDAAIEQPRYVTELIRAVHSPFSAGMSLVTGHLLDFREHREEVQRRRHTVSRETLRTGKPVVELTALGQKLARQLAEQRLRLSRERRFDPCVIFGRWCLVGWLPKSFDVSRFLQY